MTNSDNYIYLLSQRNSVKYPSIREFDCYYNNQLFNPFLDYLIDNRYNIFDCKFIDFTTLSGYDITKYKDQIIAWTILSNINSHYKVSPACSNTGLLPESYHNRDDNITIDALKHILSRDYLLEIYNISYDYFQYLNNDFNIYEVPKVAVRYVRFLSHISNMINNQPNYSEELTISHRYKDKITVNIINLNTMDKRIYLSY